MRFRSTPKKQPGPGEYSYQSFTKDGPQYSQRVKPFINPMKMKTDPGPSSYNPNPYKTYDHKYSMGQKATGSANYHTPGPGAYGDSKDDLHYKKIPGSKMGTQKRMSDHFLHTSSYKKQEPGRYSLHDFAGNKLMGTPNFSFGKDTKSRQFKMNAPGPGNYDIKSRMKDGVPCFSMPGRRKDLRPKVGVGVPGAGNYDPKHSTVKTNGPNFSVGKSQRDGGLSIFNNTPGAGTYHDPAAKITRAKSASWR